MSKLLDDLIKQSRDDAAAYEEFLRDAEEVLKRLAAKHPVDDLPHVLRDNPEAGVIYRNLPAILAVGDGPANRLGEPAPGYDDPLAQLALKIDQAMRESAPAAWKGDTDRHKPVVNAIFPLLNRDRAATAALFEIILKQPGYG